MFARLLMPDEIDDIVELARMNVFETRPDMDWDAAICRATFEKSIERANPTTYVVEDRREIIAFLMATMNAYRAASGLFINQEVLFVRPDKRGTRAAVILMKQLLALAERTEAKEITGGNDNGFHSERTAKFLEHFGFEHVGFAMRRIMADGRKE